MVGVGNWPIRTKIAALLVVPLLALGGLLAVIVRGSLSDAGTDRDAQALSRFMTPVNDLIDGLQREAVLTAIAIGSAKPGDGALAAARAQVDTEVAAFGRAARDMATAKHDASVRSHLTAAQSALAGLRDLRSGVDAGGTVRDRVDTAYRATVLALLTVDNDIDPYTSGPDLGARADTLIALSVAKEAFAREASFVAGVLATGHFGSGDYRRIIQYTGAQETLTQVFHAGTSYSEDKTYDAIAGGPQAGRVLALQEKLLATGDTKAALPVDAGTWWTAVSDRLGPLRGTEKQLTETLLGAAGNAVTHDNRKALTTLLVSLLALLFSVGLSLLVARSLVRPLRRMRSAALDTERDLIEVVQRLQQGEPVNPDQAPIPVLTKDEVGQVATAFNTVHGVAVRMAMEQAATRKSTSDTFLNIARRSQALIHRQLQLIDDMERGTTEPLELEELFRLDHLATRMRRHAEDLIVLSGSTPARGWSRPVGLRDVVRGAMAEVEDYTRITMRSLDDAEVIGPAVGDVIHLFAELLENATSFSPPTTWVYVHGQMVANGYVVEIDDAGLGMDEQRRAELNARLSQPGPFDGQSTERLGLFVVGRLAQRHNVDVHLRRSPYGGTTAIVLLPITLLQGRSAAPTLPRAGAPGGPPRGPDPAWRNGAAAAGPPAVAAAAAAAPAGTAVVALDRVPAELPPGTGPGTPDWFADDLPLPRGAIAATPPSTAADASEPPPPPTPTTPTVRVATLIARSNRTGPGTAGAGRPSGSTGGGADPTGPSGFGGPAGTDPLAGRDGPAGAAPQRDRVPLDRAGYAAQSPPDRNAQDRAGTFRATPQERPNVFDRPDRQERPNPLDRLGPLDQPGTVDYPGGQGRPGPLDRPGMVGPVTGPPGGPGSAAGPAGPAGPAAGGPGAPPRAVPTRGGQAGGSPAPAGPMPAAPIEAVTENGLPRRNRQASFTPGQAAASGPRHGPPDAITQRTPEETRALMASYQKGSDRGRQRVGEGGASHAGQDGPDATRGEGRR